MDMRRDAATMPGDMEVKTCCANLYQSDWARLLLGDSFHPGGLALTEHLGTLLDLGPGRAVLDVASGQGASAIRLAQRFGCTVLGIEYGSQAIQQATECAAAGGVAHLVSFQQGDAEHLPVPGGTFDALICECAFCTFPNKARAASEFWRALKPGGQVGLSDVTRTGEVPEDLRGLLAWIACIADAQPVEHYVRYLTTAGLIVNLVEHCNDTLAELVHGMQGKLLGVEMLARLKKIELPGTIDFEKAKALAKSAAAAIQAGKFGYAVIAATRPGEQSDHTPGGR
ncbi:MAG TPA: methyltransferase domain-containing protein [Ktedonobacteraceae bacterium]|nr:methyltransferase domain-containing protein [Ktedonobacteraceae bacterium]